MCRKEIAHYEGLESDVRFLNLFDSDSKTLLEKYNIQFDDALDYYVKASKSNNNYSSPMYLFKAGTIAMKLNKFKRAEEYFSIIKQDYPNSTEAKNIDAFISKAVASNQ